MKYNIVVLAAVLLAGSCSKEFNIDAVKPVKPTVTISNAMRYDSSLDCYIIKKEEAVTFLLKGGRVDDILFYSGECGYEYRYRNRAYADTMDNISVEIFARTAVLDPQVASPCAFKLLCSPDLADYTASAMEKAAWHTLDDDLRDGQITTGDFNSVTVAEQVMPDYFKFQNVNYAVVSKSDVAQYNRLRLRQFDVVNTEIRDYSYDLDGLHVERKVSRNSVIIKGCTLFDDAYRANNDATAACWASYTPDVTLSEGLGEKVPCSMYYVWNVADFGLRYGEGSGFPIVKNNRAGQPIKCNYDLEIYEPTAPVTLPDGRILNTPSDPLKKQPVESWLVSRAHNPRQVAKDIVSNIIKNKAMGMVESFSYSYSQTGRYTAVFYLANQNMTGADTVVKEFNLIVVD